MLPAVEYPPRARAAPCYLDVAVALVVFGFALLLIDIEHALSRIAVELERQALCAEH